MPRQIVMKVIDSKSKRSFPDDHQYKKPVVTKPSIQFQVPDDNSDDDQGDKQTRFVFDLDLTRMGPVQLDGLIQGQRLDMIVRTEMPFSEPMRQAMRQAYSDALKDTELQGDLDFQGDTKHWVNVLQKDEAFGTNA